MKKFSLIAAAAGAVMAASAWSAQAMPAAPISDALNAPIENVAMGCGPGFVRGAFGRCRPMGMGMGYRRGPGWGRPGYGRGFVGRPYRRW